VVVAAEAEVVRPDPADVRSDSRARVSFHFDPEQTSFASPGWRGLTVKNGVIRDFGDGLFMVNPSHSVVRGLDLVGNFEGVSVAGPLSETNLITDNSLTRNQWGIVVSSHLGCEDFPEGDGDNQVRSNRLFDTSEWGIAVFGCLDGTLIAGNTLRGTGRDYPFEGPTYGILFTGYGAQQLIRRNLVLDSVDFGIGLIEGAQNAVVERNRLLRSGRDGIGVDPTFEAPVGNVIRANFSSRNGDDGIDVGAARNTVARNTADRNHDLGIEAIPGVVDGGGNRASGNGNPLQCLNVFCR
jgi:parallel beta-helix repeat protein